MAVEHDPAMERARKRVKELKDFYIHVATYVSVMAFLIMIDLSSGSSGSTFLGLDWAYWPAFGWGIAVIMNGVTVMPMGGWEQRKTLELYEKERQRDEVSGWPEGSVTDREAHG